MAIDRGDDRSRERRHRTPLMAIFGWTNIRQAEVYTREAERARLAAQGYRHTDRTSIPAPSKMVRALGEKEQ